MNDIEQIEKQICEMLVVDSIVANTDRHFNNFGFLRNADTLEWEGLAPVFDTGTSMFHDSSIYDLKNGIAAIPYKVVAKPFAKNYQEQIKKLPCSKYCKDLPFNNLADISDYALTLFNQNRHLGEKTPLLCSILQDRVKETQKLILSTTESSN